MIFLKGTFSFLISVVILVVFTFTSCSSPFYTNLPKETEVYGIEPGKGTPRCVYLDTEGNVVTSPVTLQDQDPGSTLVWVDDNPQAKDVFVVAETGGGTNDDTVKIFNKQNNSVIALFFKQGTNFPWAIDIHLNNEQAGTARLSAYDQTTQSYSVTFSSGNEYQTLHHVILNKSVLHSYSDNAELSAAQNNRFRNIYASLALYLSIQQALPGSENIVVLGLSFFGWLKVIWTSFVTVAFVVALICIQPVAITVGLVLAIVLEPVVLVIGLELIDNAEAEALERDRQARERLATTPAAQPAAQPVSISITKRDPISGNYIPIDPEQTTPLRLARSEIIEYKVEFIGTFASPPPTRRYDPELYRYIESPYDRNAGFFNMTLDDIAFPDLRTVQGGAYLGLRDNSIIKVERRNISNSGYDNGLIAIVMEFPTTVIVNDWPVNIDFWQPVGDNLPPSSPTPTSKVFLLYFSTYTP